MGDIQPKDYDFSGYATKNNLKCSDGRTIVKDAFAHNDGQKVPLVWQHLHNEASNVLGHVILENRPDGVYAYGTFNSTPSGIDAKTLVAHGDITALSIYANKLKQQGGLVHSGQIREVSLVLSGANPGAFIDNLNIHHADGNDTEVEDEAIIYTEETLVLSVVKHTDESIKADDIQQDNKEILQMADEAGKTVGDVFNSMTEEQKTVVYAMIAEALDTDGGDMEQGEQFMKKNAFDGDEAAGDTNFLSHEDFSAILSDAKENGSFKAAFLKHVQTYGIENIDFLFPEAQTLSNTPTFITRDMTWVNQLMSQTRHTPFSRIKSVVADITADEARARGYVKASLKKEEVIKLLKRSTGPTTIYKKQKLDRDDMIDITDMDVVAWLKSEMRIMLDEEIARAILIGDGRAGDSEDKIDEECIRPMYKEAELYTHRVSVASDADVNDMIEAMIRARENYKGAGSPTLFTTTSFLTDMLLLKDTLGRRIYQTQAELQSALRVSNIVEVGLMSGVHRETADVIPVTMNLLGIIVNPKDYTIGADKGGSVSMFDDFDIDYNQYKYLMETRISGALITPKSALIIEQVSAG